MNDVTKIFLRVCGDAGYTRIAIDRLDLEMEVCRDWGDLSEFSHDVFAAPDLKDADGSPLLWGILEELYLVWGRFRRAG